MKPERMWELFEKHATFGRAEDGIANFAQFSAAISEAVAETIEECAQDKADAERLTPDEELLAKFYDVDTRKQIVVAQMEHIERLQARLPANKQDYFFAKVPREG